jgi:hypothetical protein
MKLATYALLLATALAGCSTEVRSPSTAAGSSDMRSDMNSRMCQVFRSYQGRGEDAWVGEACTRHLGQQDCNRCLASGL